MKYLLPAGSPIVLYYVEQRFSTGEDRKLRPYGMKSTHDYLVEESRLSPIYDIKEGRELPEIRAVVFDFNRRPRFFDLEIAYFSVEPKYLVPLTEKTENEERTERILAVLSEL